MVETPAFDITNEIPVMEHFYTIQGEGFHAGRAAYFIRLAGCDVGCSWCDVKESWKVDANQIMTIDDILNNIQDAKADFVVITGGEPLIYDLNPLTQALHKAGVEIAIETSGAYSFSGEIDWVCLSPKKFKNPLEEVYSKAQELKIIVYNNNDFKWAVDEASKVSSSCKLLLQPEWSKEEKMLPLVIDFVKENPKWQISLQTHKYMNIP